MLFTSSFVFIRFLFFFLFGFYYFILVRIPFIPPLSLSHTLLISRSLDLFILVSLPIIPRTLSCSTDNARRRVEKKRHRFSLPLSGNATSRRKIQTQTDARLTFFFFFFLQDHFLTRSRSRRWKEIRLHAAARIFRISSWKINSNTPLGNLHDPLVSSSKIIWNSAECPR